MKKILLISTTIISLFLLYPSISLAGSSLTAGSIENTMTPAFRDLDPLELEDLQGEGSLPKTPGLAAIEIYKGDDCIFAVFNKAKSYTMTVRNGAGQVVQVVSVVPAMETYTLPIATYASGQYSITFTNTEGVDIYRAVFTL